MVLLALNHAEYNTLLCLQISGKCILSSLKIYIQLNIEILCLTIRDSVSGNKYANTGPFSKFKCILKTAVTVGLGAAASKYNCITKKYLNIVDYSITSL